MHPSCRFSDPAAAQARGPGQGGDRRDGTARGAPGLALPLKQAVPARIQMGSSLGFHIILACMGIAFPAIVMIAHYRGLRRHDEDAPRLARRWARIMAVLVTVGAVSGTVLSFDMGLLWPGLMGTYGAAIGIPFSFEGIFFLLEAVFTAIYLYGWGRLPPCAHFNPVRCLGAGRQPGRPPGLGRRAAAEPVRSGQLPVRRPRTDQPRQVHRDPSAPGARSGPLLPAARAAKSAAPVFPLESGHLARLPGRLGITPADSGR
jgi:hypothetical protein